MLSTTPDYTAIKTKQKAAWTSGDYGRIGTTLQIVGERLAEAMDMTPGSGVLDVAAGNGNVSLALARRFCDVTSTDYVSELLDQGRQRAVAEALDIRFQVADAEQLPFEDESFDGVASTFGVMFAPHQAEAARELLRVCRRGGKIGMANWIPEGFIGQLFATLGRHLPPPPGLSSPALWGKEAWLRDVFGAAAGRFVIVQKEFVFRYGSAEHFLEVFRTYYGPVHKAFLALEPQAQRSLEKDIKMLIARFDTSRDGTMRVPSSYAEVVIVKA